MKKISRRAALLSIGSSITTVGCLEIADGGKYTIENSPQSCKSTGDNELEKGAWPMDRFDAAATGRAPAQNGPKDFPLELKWSESLPSTDLKSPIVDNEAVYVATSSPDGIVAAYDVETGNRRWLVKRDELIPGSPAVSNNNVFIPIEHSPKNSHELLVINKEDGDEVGNFHTTSSITADIRIKNGTIYIGTGEDQKPTLEAVNRTSRTRCWSATLGDRIRTINSISIQEDMVYITGSGINSDTVNHGMVGAISLNESIFSWREKISEEAVHDISATNEAVYIVADKTIRALDRSNGDERWRISVPDRRPAQPKLSVSQDRVFVGTDQQLLAIDATTNDTLWRASPEGTHSVNPVLIGNQVFAVSHLNNDDSLVFVVDAESGDVRWKQELPGVAANSLAVAKKRVFVGTNKGTLHVFR